MFTELDGVNLASDPHGDGVRATTLRVQWEGRGLGGKPGTSLLRQKRPAVRATPGVQAVEPDEGISKCSLDSSP